MSTLQQIAMNQLTMHHVYQQHEHISACGAKYSSQLGRTILHAILQSIVTCCESGELNPPISDRTVDVDGGHMRSKVSPPIRDRTVAELINGYNAVVCDSWGRTQYRLLCLICSWIYLILDMVEKL